MLVKDANMGPNTFINVYLLVCHISMNRLKIIIDIGLETNHNVSAFREFSQSLYTNAR